jgi:hypothetical protein
MSSPDCQKKSNCKRSKHKQIITQNDVCDLSLKNDIFQNSESTISENTKNTLQRSSQDERKKGKWTKEEDEILERVVLTYGQKSWKKVSEYVKGRTPIQCLHRWTKILKPGLIKGPWTIEQDRKLLDWVKREGPGQWSQCAEFITGRSGKQCRERWFNTLNPDVKKGNWSPEEDFIIFDSYRQFGSHWTKIAEKLPGRTENSIKNRFYSTLRRISSRKKVEKNQIECVSSSSIPLNKLVEYLPEALLEKTMNFIKFKNENKTEKISLESEKVNNSKNINCHIQQYNGMKNENNNQLLINSYNTNINLNNNHNNLNNHNNHSNNNPYNNMHNLNNSYGYNANSYAQIFPYNMNNNMYPVNNTMNDLIDKYNYDNNIKSNNINNISIPKLNNPYLTNNTTSNIYNPISNQNHSFNLMQNNLINNNLTNHMINEPKLFNPLELNNNHEDYNQLKELPLDIIENNIENMCDLNPFKEPNITLLDNQINDFIDNFFENNNIQEENIGSNLFCFGCNDIKKESLNNVAKNEVNNEANVSKDKVLNSLLDQLNELEKLLQNSKNELINKMNKMSSSNKNHLTINN